MDGREQNWRLTVQLTKEQENALLELRKQDEFCRMSYGEILRRMLDVGLRGRGFNDAHRNEEPSS